MTSHPDFPQVQRRLKALGLYAGVIDDEWGPGMATGVSALLTDAEKARGIEPPKAPLWSHLPANYAWLRDVGPLPRHLVALLDLLGTKETSGAANSPVIMGWVAECERAGVHIAGYSADSVPWCGLGMAVAMVRAGRTVPDGPLWALNWDKFGVDGGQPELGDVLTFQRPGGGHVAQYIAEDKQGFYHVLGCNQSDTVSIMRIAKSRMHGCRQPPYNAKPASVRAYVVAPSGTVSHNEA